MYCEICHKTLEQVPLFRVNEKGTLGIWRCGTHIQPEKKPPQDLKDLIDQINEGY